MITVDKAWKQILGKQIRSNFLRSTSLQILANKSGCVQTNLLFFIHHIWGERVLWGAVFIIQTSTKCSISQFFKTNYTHSIFSTINRGLLAKPFKHFQNHLYGQPVLTLTRAKFAVNINRVTLQHNKEFVIFIFLFNGFITMCNLKKRLIRAVFWVVLRTMFMSDWNKRHSD